MIEGTQKTNFKGKSPPKALFVCLRPLRGTEACSYRETWDWIWRWNKIITTIGISRISEFWGENKVIWLSNRELLNKFQASDWDVDIENRPLVTEKFKIKYGDELKLIAHLDSSENQNAEARIKHLFLLNITA